MKVKEYFEMSGMSKYDKVTFIKAECKKVNNHFNEHAYTTSPILTIEEVLNTKLAECYILNDDTQPIDWLSGCPWSNMYLNGNLKCMLVISKEELNKLYSIEQGEEIIRYIDTKLNEKLERK